MKKVTVKQLRLAMLHISDVIIENEPYLTEVDTVIGDGDHGVGMKRGFTALRVMLEASAFDAVDDLFRAVGVELVRSMGGASGVIFGTMFIGGIGRLGHNGETDVRALSEYFSGGLDAVIRRGRAQAGQKTMLDALIPASNALAAAADRGKDVEDALKDAYDAAKVGVEATKDMQSRVGRSKNFREASRGLPDPGAISTSLIFGALYEAVAG